MAAYPSTLPRPLSSGYSINPSSAVLRTEMEVGAARQRRITSQPPSRISLVWNFTQEEFAIFEAWWHYTVQQGQAWFDMSLANGLGYATQSCRFTGPYKADHLKGFNFRVDAEVEVRSLPIMSEATLATKV